MYKAGHIKSSNQSPQNKIFGNITFIYKIHILGFYSCANRANESRHCIYIYNV